MLNPQYRDVIDIPPGFSPLLAVIVDAEEEFDWGKPVSRNNTGVTAMRSQVKAHRIFERYGITPTYLVDFPVATQPDGYLPLVDLFKDGLCEIGAHLHPWVNPPFEEVVSERTSYPGNLPATLEEAKLNKLTAAIEESFGISPKIYRAGRFGVGPATADILERRAFDVDTSVVPESDFRKSLGPDFRNCPASPYWFGKARKLLELPLSVGFAGLLAQTGRTIYPLATVALARTVRLPGILARSGLLERIRLTPEGIQVEEQQRLTGVMLNAGHKIFTLTYHSPSLAPGNTPYVRSHRDLGEFLDRLQRYFDYFFGKVGGRPTTVIGISSLARALTSSSRSGHPHSEASAARSP